MKQGRPRNQLISLLLLTMTYQGELNRHSSCRKTATFFIILSFLVCLIPQTAVAQTQLRISGATRGFPVAVPDLCGDQQSALSKTVTDRIYRNLGSSGLFTVVPSRTYIPGAQKCGDGRSITFSDWSVIGAEGLVTGDMRSLGDGRYEIEMFLHDVLQQRSVIGKRYQSSDEDLLLVADRFSNEIVRFFTGEQGIFGTKLAYVGRSGRFKELYVMDMDGTNNRRLTNDKGLVMTPSWSPTGKRIAFTSYKSRRPELYTISPEGTGQERVTRLEGLELGAEYSNSGQEFLTSASLFGVPNIVTMNMVGKVLRKVTTSSAIDLSPSYSPDNRQVVFCSNRSGGPQIYITSSEGETRTRARRVSFTNSNYCTSPSWSPSGDKIAFVCRDGGHQIFTVRPDGSNTTQLTFSGYNEDPTWSPDGKFLAFSSDGGRGGPRKLVSLHLASGKTQPMGQSSAEQGQPAWSPRFQ